MGKPKNPKNGGPAARDAAGTINLEAWRGKARLVHGIRSTINSGGQIPPSLPYAAEIKSEVEGLLSQMEADLGGEDQITAQQRTILQSQRLCITVLRLASVYLEQQGLVNAKTGRPHGLLSVCVSFVNAARLNSLALGLERRARKVGPGNLAEYIESRNQQKTESPTQ